MLNIDNATRRLEAIGCSDVLLRFLTDDERAQLEKLARRFGTAADETELERAGQIIWAAQRRAEMRHPGFE